MIKSKDTLTIVVLAVVVAVLTLFVSNAVLSTGGDSGQTTKVEVVDPINGQFNYIDKPYFGEGAINPTEDIEIQQNNNENILNSD